MKLIIIQWFLLNVLMQMKVILEDWIGSIQISFEETFKWSGRYRSNLNLLQAPINPFLSLFMGRH